MSARIDRKWYAGSAALGAAAVAYIGTVDPHRPGAMFTVCPFKLITGWNCPGCGGLRMTHDILHGDVHGAVMDNVFLLVGLPLLAIWLLWRLRRRRRVLTTPALVVIGVLALLWTVVRNLPGFPLVPTMLGS